MTKRLTVTAEIEVHDSEETQCSKHCKFLDREYLICNLCMEELFDAKPHGILRCKQCLEGAE